LLLLDVTHQISRYNLNMALLVGIDNEAKTIILCYGLFQKQQSESMDWFLMGISSLLNKLNIPKPKTILTDDDKTLRTNLLKHFPNSQHLLCSWHVYQNFLKKIKQKGARKILADIVYNDNLLEVEKNISLLKAEEYLSNEEQSYLDIFDLKWQLLSNLSKTFSNEYIV